MIKCPYCQSEATLRDTAIIYGRSYGNAWICTNFPECDSYVGVHKETDKPLGTLANKELRTWRKRIKLVFNSIWKGGMINSIYPKYLKDISNRSKAYVWLSIEMKLSSEETHIGMFNVEQCEQALKICDNVISKQIEPEIKFDNL